MIPASSSSQRRGISISHWSPIHRMLLATTALAPLGLGVALANPVGPQVVGGAATVTGTGTANVTVHQTTDRAAINWHTFNIAPGERTQFIQPSSSSVALNRVTGGLGASQIYGSISANGRVFVVNPYGVMIGGGATINTAGFLATSHDITNSDFMAGRYNFNIPGRPDASVVNHGAITASQSGFAALVAPGVRNTGTIIATLGTVGLGAGNGFTLDFYGDQLIRLAVNDSVASTVKDVSTGQPLDALIKNEGKIRANGGRVELSAAAARKVVDSVINNTGVIEANSIGTRNGMIVLGAATAQSKPADAPAQTVKVSGTLSAAGKKKGQKGGTIQVTGENIQLANAKLDASGRAGGGKVLVGGDVGGGKGNAAVASLGQAQLEAHAVPTATDVSVDTATTIDASARNRGDGGKVVLWADRAMNFYGTVVARGGANAGNGGFAEISGKQTLSFAGLADLRAPKGGFGTLLLDPADFFLDLVGGPIRPTGSSVMTNVALQNQLDLGNVVIATNNASNPIGQNGDIVVAANVSWGSGATPNTSLKFDAFRDIVFTPSVTVTNTGSGDFTLRADSTGSGTGTVKFLGAGTQIDSSGTGRVNLFFNPSGKLPGVNTTNYVNPTELSTYAGAIDGLFTAYMLVNNANDLQNIKNNPSGTYALGKDIDLNLAGFTALGTFTGLFDGDGRTISNLTLSGPAPVGNNAGTIRNLTLDNFNVTVTADNQFAGLLAAQNTGTIENVTVSGTITGGAHTGLTAGGLVGSNGGTLAGNLVVGTIKNSHAAVHITAVHNISCTDGCTTGMNQVGGLVGFNPGTIEQSSASGNIVVGAHTTAGGLVGVNQLFFASQNNPAPGAPQPLIEDSFATGNVTSSGLNVQIGGLVGYNFGRFNYLSSALIQDSRASGAVTASASVSSDCSIAHCEYVNAGGLVGFNQGFIAGTVTPSGITTLSTGTGTYALGAVSVGARGVGGGLAGQNDGIIGMTLAKGAVTGAAGTVGSGHDHDRQTTLGGLVGFNHGLIGLSTATGDVGTVNVPHLQAGGLVGSNHGAIVTSHATGHVKAGDNSMAGGFAGSNEGSSFNCSGCNLGVGFNSAAVIGDSDAIGSVTVGASSIAGGFAGMGGFIAGSNASGAVTADNNSILGGFAGVVDLNSIIAGSHSTGAVTGIGANNWIGGFAGVNAGMIFEASNSGTVTGDTASVIGGLVGLNVGRITESSTLASATVTGTGADNVVGGLVGANFGSIVESTSAGNVFGGVNNTVGGLVGANGNIANVAPDQILLSSFPLGTIDDLSAATGTASGGTGSTVGAQVGTHNLAALPPSPSVLQKCDDGLCVILKNPTLISSDSDLPDDALVLPGDHRDSMLSLADAEVINAIIALVSQDPPPGDGGPGSGPGSRPPAGSQTPGVAVNVLPPQPLRPVAGADGERFSSIPPLGETRFITNEVVLQMQSDIPAAEVERIARQLGMTVVGSQTLGSIGRTAYRFNFSGGRTIRDVIRALEANRVVAVASPNYRFRLTQPGGALAEKRGDPSQYMIGKLKLEEAHLLAAGRNVTVAVIDSEVDRSHSELRGVVSGGFNASGEPEKAHSHGTAMAGAIAAQDRLLGVAPSARILAVRAFSQAENTAESTTYSILKSIDWAVSQGARVINMSFAGPPDPSLKKALKNAYDKGVVLIAAAGNAGPKSGPLYPGADPSVIAVTATDSNDRGFRQANQGFYVAVSAPGVDILAPAPEAGYQMSTGTSIATAHVSGVVALMLERDPTLTPADVRRILESTAIDLGPKGRDAQYGWGLVSPQRALAAVDARRAAARSSVSAPPR